MTDAPRLFRLTVTLPDGRRRSRIVKTTNPANDVAASLGGLVAHAGGMLADREVRRVTISTPETIGPRQRQHLMRWYDALDLMLA